jgi:hypothetical protein
MRRTLMACTLAALTLGVPSDNAYAQTTTSPDQIQEDWQVVIGVPDPSNAGPQISTYLSPVSDGSKPFFVFDLNYQDSPTFAAGGMQVQVWSGDTLVAGSTKGTAQLSTTNETITWTSVMSISPSTGTVSFGINSGKSTTWGKFGQGQQLNVNGSFTTNLTSLSNYSPATSVANSGVGWESNRVTSMTLLRVRYYAGGKLLSTDNTARSVSLSN